MKSLITIQSSYSVKETIDRLSSIVESKGITVFVRIDHSENARKHGLDLRPTELIIFGNPNVGTGIMQDNQTSGIDLPMRALAWQDEAGSVWLTYNDVKWLADRHNLTSKSNATLQAIEEGMTMVGDKATKK